MGLVGRKQMCYKGPGLLRAYATVEELIGDGNLNAVSIAVPNVFHAEMAFAALRAGKHVLLEKPMATSYGEAAAIAEAARNSGKVFTVGMNQRFTEESQIIKALAERGDLGEIYHAKAYWFRRSGIPVLGTWFNRKEMAGGGGLYDIGVHLLDLCLHLMDNFEVQSVSGATYSKFGPRGLGGGTWGMSEPDSDVFDVDDFATAFIKMKNGATVSLDVSWAIHQKEASRHNVALHGTEAGAGVFPTEIYRYGREKGEYEVVTPQNVKIPYPHNCRFANWLESILEKDKLLVSLSEALEVQKILDASSSQAVRDERYDWTKTRAPPKSGVAMARLTISDQGPGIPAEYRERIFDKYGQPLRHTGAA